jgi:hypothetical protein
MGWRISKLTFRPRKISAMSVLPGFRAGSPAVPFAMRLTEAGVENGAGAVSSGTKPDRQEIDRWQVLRRHAPLAFVIAALVCGGAGSQHPLVSMIAVLLALAVVALLGNRLAVAATDRIDRIALWLCVAVVAVVLVQLVPLPPALWLNLPGHEPVAAVDAALGQSVWRPINLAPDLGFDMALALIAPIVAFLLGRTGTTAERQSWIRALIGCALAAALLGLAQLAAGADGGLGVWDTIHAGTGVGWFVNRNHQAAFLLVAIVFAGVPGSLPFEAGAKRAGFGTFEQGLMVGAVIALIAAGVLATLSRTGVALLPLALAFAGGLRQPRKHVWLAVPAVGLLVALLLVAANSAIGDDLAGRYGLAAQDGRFFFWTNTLHTMGTYMPFGSGFGTFVGIYQMVEPLDQVGLLYVVHAHDDYLEWLLEGGLLVVPIMAIGLGCLATRLAGVLRSQETRSKRQAPRRPDQRALVLAAFGAILVMALASVTDFPLRMVALGVVLGLCAGFIARPGPPDVVEVVRAGSGRRRRSAYRDRGLKALWAMRRRVPTGPVIAGVLALLVVSADMSLDLVIAGDGSDAISWASWRARGWTLRALGRLQHGQALAAGDDAARALSIDPLDPAAVRVAGLAAAAAHQHGRELALANVAGQLGWRDLPTQVWLAQLAEDQGNLAYETQRVDALLRQQTVPDRAIDFLVALVADPDGRAVVLARLEDSPAWMQGFFNRLADPAPMWPDAVVTLVKQAVQNGVRLNPDTLGIVVWRLAEHGSVDAARSIRETLGGAMTLGDGDFASVSGRLPDLAPPYHWHATPGEGGDVYIGDDELGGGRALHVESDGRALGEAAVQRLLLTPGRYHLSAHWSVVDGDRTTRPRWAIRCIAPVAQKSDQGADQDLAVISDGEDLVIPRGCDQQDLRLQLGNTMNRPYHVAVQHVMIDRLG